MNIQVTFRYFRFALVGLLLTVLIDTQASAAVIDLNFVAAATATDNGPQDGVFDAFPPSNFGSVVNNGFTSFRTALEFDISAVPAGYTINAATLTMRVGFVEGTRQIALHGYAGDGTISLGDFSRDGVVDNATLSPAGLSSQTVVFDAKAFLDSLVQGGEAFAGFNLREDPANSSNFLVLFFNMDGPTAPRLSVEAVPEPSAISLFGVGLLALLFATKLRRRQNQ